MAWQWGGGAPPYRMIGSVFECIGTNPRPRGTPLQAKGPQLVTLKVLTLKPAEICPLTSGDRMGSSRSNGRTEKQLILQSRTPAVGPVLTVLMASLRRTCQHARAPWGGPLLSNCT